MGWRVMTEGRSFDREMMGSEHEVKKAYKEGYEEGYEDAIEEMEGRGGYGQRDGDYDRSYSRDNDSGYGERRGVKNTGRYAGEYRRRRGY